MPIRQTARWLASPSVALESKFNVPAELHWQAIALRLVLTLIAGGLLGMERSRTGHAAGMRTTLLVTLAASVAMIQMNLLIPTNGKPSDSYAVMDLMRLPLGILTGVGFIGAGAIVRKNELVLGITTAATLWFATVVGLCMGGGQVILGSVSTVLGFGVLWGLRHFEKHVEQYQLAELTVVLRDDRTTLEELRARLKASDFKIKSFAVSSCKAESRRRLHYELRWPSQPPGDALPPVIAELEHLPGVVELEWNASSPGPQ
jgi:putative Mg2+ transporter-C (MgtC) family protein